MELLQKYNGKIYRFGVFGQKNPPDESGGWEGKNLSDVIDGGLVGHGGLDVVVGVVVHDHGAVSQLGLQCLVLVHGEGAESPGIGIGGQTNVFALSQGEVGDLAAVGAAWLLPQRRCRYRRRRRRRLPYRQRTSLPSWR